jgi:metallo-beta-lactamase class B
VYLGAHGYWYDLPAKMQRMGKGGANPFIDPQGYRSYLDAMERAFQDQVRREGGQL